MTIRDLNLAISNLAHLGCNTRDTRGKADDAEDGRFEKHGEETTGFVAISAYETTNFLDWGSERRVL